MVLAMTIRKRALRLSDDIWDFADEYAKDHPNPNIRNRTDLIAGLLEAAADDRVVFDVREKTKRMRSVRLDDRLWAAAETKAQEHGAGDRSGFIRQMLEALKEERLHVPRPPGPSAFPADDFTTEEEDEPCK